MIPPSPRTHPLPAFRRPSEAVVFWTLDNLCGGPGGRYLLSLRHLAQRCNLAVNTTHRAVRELARRGVIRYRPGLNQSCPSIYQMPADRGEGLSPKPTAVAKIGVAIPSDNQSNHNDLYIGDIYDGETVHRQRGDSAPTPEERLARQVAEGLDDLENLALYRSYCRRFPADLILKAYVRAREPTPDRIRKSRGALFNFLVQLYAKKRNLDDDTGPSSR